MTGWPSKPPWTKFEGDAVASSHLSQPNTFPRPSIKLPPQTIHKRQQPWHQGLFTSLPSFPLSSWPWHRIQYWRSLIFLLGVGNRFARVQRPSTNSAPCPFPHNHTFTTGTGHGTDDCFWELDLGAHPSINAILAVRSSRTTTAARARGKLGAQARVGRAVMLGGMGIRGLRMGRRG